ncbi:MAG: response regulator [Lewinellaceae bacterium]|nr:response regulator [Saprospiraceae bacterium]MCB9333502.1 response regulator [Lewinellaceae bacterium]
MPARILVVDDEPRFERLVLQRLRKGVQEGIYEFSFAADGLEALEIFKQDPAFNMVLTDINMPRMDGLTLLERLREINPLLKVVIVSAYGDMPNIRKAMNLGAFDFVTKPIEFADLELTIRKTLEEADLLKEAAKSRELAEKNEMLEELDQLKTRFFTNISHEFRTPLTVIAGMTGQIGENPERWLDRGLTMIRRNTSNMLDLVRQILDLNKLESGRLEVDPIKADIIPFLRYLVESFQPLAETRDIRLSFHSGMETLVMDFDPEKMLRIISNLLGNALKFCAEGDQVDVEVETSENNMLRIRVRDTGPGIPAGQLPHIFDRFYQAKDANWSNTPGTGIGLSLVQEFTRLLDGVVTVESREGEGAIFTVELPIRQEAQKPDTDVAMLSPERYDLPASPMAQTGDESELELPSLLLVEDNTDIVQYLMSCLEGRYQLSWAKDGEEGIATAIETVPDIIISDVMMPRKDGFELCQTLKADTRTSHIPIILLTAKADVESKIAGLRRGADAYLAKPFDKQELLARLENLLELRARLQARYRMMEDMPVADEEALQQEDQFVSMIKEAIHAHMDEEEFGIHELCRAIGVSRTQLHRKIKALTGRSTSSLIRYFRLLHAKQLLMTSDLNLSQVAYDCGFRDPKYFSNTFTEEFGIRPRDFRKGSSEQ